MSKVKKPYVGIIILTYNAEQFIINCLHSVLANDYGKFACVVVDNASTDNTILLIRRHFPKIKIIENKKNVGYAAGNNIGIRYFLSKQADYILLLNPDTTVLPTLLSDCIYVSIHRNRIGILGPLITEMKDKKRIWFAGGYYNSWLCFSQHPHMGQLFPDAKITSRSVDFITGACMFIRADIFTHTGLLPEEYFMYCEDLFFSRTVIANGYDCYFLAKPLVQHATTLSFTPLRAYYFGRNYLLYFRKYVRGVKKITNYFGQFFIQFPFYSCLMIQKGDFKSLTYYIKGMFDGMSI
jgi:GT2 family glycosyltransferase